MLLQTKNPDHLVLRPVGHIYTDPHELTMLNLIHARALFAGFHDEYTMVQFGLDVPQRSVSGMHVNIFEMQPESDASLETMFDIHTPGWFQIEQQNQIIQIIDKFSDQLSKSGNYNLFPIRVKENEHVIMHVMWGADNQYYNRLYPLARPHIYAGKNYHRVFKPLE